ncbi:MAG: hypothetical protein KDC24_04645 [Saprospiraceae bacterium]|nr:hypothetical protein [Saprospiraceae bacterium]
MKFLRLALLSLSLSSMALSFTACGSETPETEQTGKEYTSAYVCPMHCEGSGSDQPGKCPSCGMDYVKNDSAGEHHEEGHTH